MDNLHVVHVVHVVHVYVVKLFHFALDACIKNTKTDQYCTGFTTCLDVDYTKKIIQQII